MGGVRTLVVEARDVPGGVVRGHTVGGLRLDAGAESFATRGGVVAAYLRELGLDEQIVAPAPLGSWVHLPSGDGPLPRTGLLGIPSTPWSADVRRTLGWLGAARASLDLVLPARVGAGATTLAGLVRARMGSRVLDRLVRPIVGGVHAAEPDDLAIDAVAPGLAAAVRDNHSLARAVRRLRASAPAGSAVQGLMGGLHTLTDTLVNSLTTTHTELRLSTTAHPHPPPRTPAEFVDDPPVRRVSPTTSPQPAELGGVGGDGGGGPGGFVVRVGGGVVVAERVVVAVPDVGLIAGLCPEGTLSTGLAADPGAAITLVTLVLRPGAVVGAPRGTGVLVGRDATDVTAKALTHATAKWPWLAARADGAEVVRLSYGRAGADDGTDALLAETVAAAGWSGGTRPADAPPAPLLARAVADAATLLGCALTDDDVTGYAFTRWTQALPRPSARHRDTVDQVRAAVASTPGVAACGAWLAGNGLASVIPDAQRAARSLL